MSSASELAKQVNEVLDKVTGGRVFLAWPAEDDPDLLPCGKVAIEVPGCVQGGQVPVVLDVGPAGHWYLGDVWLVSDIIDALRKAAASDGVEYLRDPRFKIRFVWRALVLLSRFTTDYGPPWKAPVPGADDGPASP